MRFLNHRYRFLDVTVLFLVAATTKPCFAESWPTLENYVEKCVLIVKAKTTVEQDGRLTFRVIETWKGRYDPQDFVETAEDGRFFASQHEHGVDVVAGQEIVFFFTRHNQPIEGKLSRHSTAFPIRNGKLTYASTSDWLKQEFTIAEFKKRILDIEAKRQIPVIVHARLRPVVKGTHVYTNLAEADKPIPLEITIFNGLRSCIYHSTFSNKPNTWNGETANISLVDIYRNDKQFNLYLARPKIDVPVGISGMGRYEIKPVEKLLIQTDAHKWTLRDGWLPGRYKVTLRVDNLTADRYCNLSILSDPIEFEIK